jgi:hypothetical protein
MEQIVFFMLISGPILFSALPAMGLLPSRPCR